MLGGDSISCFMTFIRRNTDKKRSKKYDEKNLVRYLKTLQPDSIEKKC